MLPLITNGVSNCGPWAKSGPLLVFVNKALVAQSHSHAFTDCLWLLFITVAEWIVVKKTLMA